MEASPVPPNPLARLREREGPACGRVRGLFSALKCLRYRSGTSPHPPSPAGWAPPSPASGRGAAFITAAILAGLWVQPAAAQITTNPQMFVSGGLTPPGSLPFTLQAGQQILAVDAATNIFLPLSGNCSSANPNGACGYLTNPSQYQITILEPLTFSDKIGLRLLVNGKYYTLYDGANAANPLLITYRGSDNPFAPSIQSSAAILAASPDTVPPSLPPTSTGTSSSTTGTSTTATTTPVAVCPTALPKCDANGDGVFDHGDIDFIRKALTQRVPPASADVNGDGVVDTKDLLDALRALSQMQRQQVMGVTAPTGQ